MTTRTKAVSEVTPLTESFTGWAKLNTDEQKILRVEADAVDEARVNEQHSKEAQGRHLEKIQTLLLPKRMYVAFLKYKWKMSVATSYRYIDLHKVATELLTAPMYEAAIARGTPIRKEIIEQNPPPDTDDPVKMGEYLQKIESLPQRRPQAALESDPEVLQKESLNFVGTRLDRLRANGKDERFVAQWTKEFCAMLFTKAGIKREVKIVAVPVPESFEVHRGRRPTANQPKAA